MPRRSMPSRHGARLFLLFVAATFLLSTPGLGWCLTIAPGDSVTWCFDFSAGPLPAPFYDQVSVTWTNIDTGGSLTIFSVLDEPGSTLALVDLAEISLGVVLANLSISLLPPNFAAVFDDPIFYGRIEAGANPVVVDGLATGAVSLPTGAGGTQVVSPVPEPGTLLLVGTGLFGAAGWGRTRRKMQ